MLTNYFKRGVYYFDKIFQFLLQYFTLKSKYVYLFDILQIYI